MGEALDQLQPTVDASSAGVSLLFPFLVERGVRPCANFFAAPIAGITRRACPVAAIPRHGWLAGGEGAEQRRVWPSKNVYRKKGHGLSTRTVSDSAPSAGIPGALLWTLVAQQMGSSTGRAPMTITGLLSSAPTAAASAPLTTTVMRAEDRSAVVVLPGRADFATRPVLLAACPG
jgi:hypothetical protein